MIHELDSTDVDNSNRGADSNGGADSTFESSPDPALFVLGIAMESAPENLES